MKVTCSISGLTYNVPSGFKGTAIHPHPLLAESFSAYRLVKDYLEPWSQGLLGVEDTHLLGLALLLKLPVACMPKLPANSCHTLASFWAKYMERLARLAIKLEGKDFKKLPKLVITCDTLENLPHWIDTLYTEVSLAFSPISEKAKKLNKGRGKVESEDKGTYSQEEISSIMTRGLKGSPLSAKESRTFPKLIADWACTVGQFPTAYVTNENGKKIVIATLWKGIIEKAFSKDGLADILSEDVTLADADELLEYCYCEIPAGSLHASYLFKKLESVKEILEEFRGGNVVFKPAKFDGTDSDLLSLLEGEESPVTIRSEEPISPSQKLAIRMAALRAKS